MTAGRESLFQARRLLRVLAFVPLSPVYGVGYFLLGCIEDDEDDPWDDWPLEARCLLGYAAPFMLLALLLGLGAMLLWEQFDD